MALGLCYQNRSIAGSDLWLRQLALRSCIRGIPIACALTVFRAAAGSRAASSAVVSLCAAGADQL
jgi:hypothetical protein